MNRAVFALIVLSLAGRVLAHDTWVETQTNLIRNGDAVYIDLKLGNHGNNHRDFKLASKVDLESCTLRVIDPNGKSYDVKDHLIDTGYAPNEGYWKAKFVAVKSGIYTVAHTVEKIVNHGRPLRSLKSGKTYFAASPTLDRVSPIASGFEMPLGHPLELVPVANPVLPMGPGQAISVRVMLHGKPLPAARVSFIPRRQTLKNGFDNDYERLADEQGLATFTPKTGDQYLVVVHHLAEKETGPDYEGTKYSATLSVFVPEVCPCCGE